MTEKDVKSLIEDGKTLYLNLIYRPTESDFIMQITDRDSFFSELTTHDKRRVRYIKDPIRGISFAQELGLSGVDFEPISFL